MAKQATNAVLKPALLLVVSLVLLLAAYGFQYIGKMEPCEMCYWQRYAYYVAIPFLAMAVLLAADTAQNILPRFFIGLATLAFMTGSGIAAYHVGVEHGWWAGPESCTGGGLVADTAEAFLEALKGTNIVRCDEIPWSLFGISMAGYNFLASVVLSIAGAIFTFGKQG